MVVDPDVTRNLIGVVGALNRALSESLEMQLEAAGKADRSALVEAWYERMLSAVAQLPASQFSGDPNQVFGLARLQLDLVVGEQRRKLTGAGAVGDADKVPEHIRS